MVIVVPEGDYDRSNDANYPATIASFRLDAYEVTVGRFKRFVAGYADGLKHLVLHVFVMDTNGSAAKLFAIARKVICESANAAQGVILHVAGVPLCRISIILVQQGHVSVLSAKQVEVSWSPSPSTDVVGYHVERATSASGPWTRVTNTSPVTGTSFTDANLPSAETAYYRVLAVDGDGNLLELSIEAARARATVGEIAVSARSVSSPIIFSTSTGAPESSITR